MSVPAIRSFGVSGSQNWPSATKGWSSVCSCMKTRRPRRHSVGARADDRLGAIRELLKLEPAASEKGV